MSDISTRLTVVSNMIISGFIIHCITNWLLSSQWMETYLLPKEKQKTKQNNKEKNEKKKNERATRKGDLEIIFL